MKQRLLVIRLFFAIFFVLFFSRIVMAGVPIPWGAKLIQGDVAVVNGEDRKMVSYETNASKQELLNYYLRQMPGQGYSLFMSGEQNLIFMKGKELVVIILTPPKEGKTQFMIMTSPSALGGARNSEANCEDIPSIPAYPGARCVQSMHMKSGRAQSVTYSSDDSIDAVYKYYCLSMVRSQWRLDKELNLDDTMSKIKQAQDKAGAIPENAELAANLFKGARTVKFVNDRGNGCVISLINSPLGKGTSVSITYEEKTTQ